MSQRCVRDAATWKNGELEQQSTPSPMRRGRKGNAEKDGGSSILLQRLMLTPVDLSSCTVEQMIHCLHEALAQSLELLLAFLKA
eukprot:scaffold285638_cov15-Tisochrysis_lutea.AAC.1